jgi:microcystin-dependent protein
MSNPPFFYTGNSFSDSFFWIAVRFPNSQDNWLFSTFLGALYNMGELDAWVTQGETTSQEAASIFRDIFDNRIRDMPWSIGDVKFTGAEPDSGVWLLCDGANYSETVYANLFARIGTTFNTGGEPSGTFRVPDMRGRAPVMTNNFSGRLPSWADSPGGSGGESTHVLTTAELASHGHTNTPHTHTLTPHTHSEGNATLASASPPVPPAVVPSAVPSVGITGAASDGITSDGISIDNTGDDTAHNNVQPSMALACYILADF